MPKYQNNGTIPTTVGGYRVEPGLTVETLDFIQNLPANVTKISDLPNYRPIIYSNKFTGNATIGVPANYIDNNGASVPLLGRYEIEVYVGVGECTVNINDNTTVSEYVGLYQSKKYVCNSPQIKAIHLVVSASTVYVTIRKI